MSSLVLLVFLPAMPDEVLLLQPRLTSNSWTQVILLAQSPKQLVHIRDTTLDFLLPLYRPFLVYFQAIALRLGK